MNEVLEQKLLAAGTTIQPTGAFLGQFRETFSDGLVEAILQDAEWVTGNALTRYILRLPVGMGGFDFYPVAQNPKQWSLVARGMGGRGVLTSKNLDLGSDFILAGTREENDRDFMVRVNRLKESVAAKVAEMELAKTSNTKGFFARLIGR